jgi:3-oxoadipate enol-lactonase
VSAVRLERVVDAGPELRPDAPVVLMMSSIGTTTRMWDPQVPPLSAAYRVVRLNARGHGRSPAPLGDYDIDDLADDALAVLDDLGVERAHLVGLSMGGMTALRLAVREPERVDRMVVLCTSARLGPPQMWIDRAALVRAEGMEPVVESSPARWLTEDFRVANPELVARLQAMVRDVDAEGYAACCGVIERMDLRGDLAAIRAPLLAIAGAQDPVTGPDHLRAIADGVQRGRLLVLDPASHLANVEQGPAVTAAVLEHLAGRGRHRQATDDPSSDPSNDPSNDPSSDPSNEEQS